jgi:hypothetical protein
MGLRRILVSVLALALAGCASLSRAPAPIDHPAATIEGFEKVRIRGSDPTLIDVVQRNLERTRAASDRPISVLALSGGGAEGAFGAGVMVGWTKSGTRPEFQVVTGVSAGALIAPFAYLGPEWDGKLKEAFAGKLASRLLTPRGIGSVAGESLYSGGPLEELVERYVDEKFLAAVARENAKGRKLLVATTDLDRQETVIWNLGEIAARGGPQARRLFRDVLVASASIPGVFPPKLIRVRDGATVYQEMHVDGGITTPFFSVPPQALAWTEPSGLLKRARLYVIVNAQLDKPPQTISPATVSVLGRSADTVQLSIIRNTLVATQGFCARNGVSFQGASLPASGGSLGPFDFSAKNRKRLFRLGERLGASGEAWNLARPAVQADGARQSP